MSVTTPYAPDTASLLPFTMGQDVIVTATGATLAAPLVLEVQDGSTISWDEGRAPRCLATVVVRVPEDQATLDALDPRAGVTLTVQAGYLRPGDVRDVQTIARLVLTDRRVSRPGNTMTLTASGAEQRVLEAGGPTSAFTPTATTVTAAVLSILTAALGAAPAVAESTLASVAPSAPPVVASNQDWWAAADDLVDRVAGDLFDDGLGSWHLRPRPTVATTPAHTLTVGVRGTLLTAETSLSRAGWSNVVQLIYTWTTVESRQVGTDSTGAPVYQAVQVDHLVVGQASVTAGPFTPATAGRVLFRDYREVATTQADANVAAAAVLVRRLAGARSLELSAIAAWWLRPGHTIAVTLPTGPTELHLVVAVTFDLVAGRMSLTTRRPDTDSTVTQGA